MERYIIIPVLEPDPMFGERVENLIRRIPARIVVVDDGSGPDYREIFARVGGIRGCSVLHHRENKGKGRALKTGFAYVRRRIAERKAAGGILETKKPVAVILCLDSDGQHLPEDGEAVLELAGCCPGTLILGGRNFAQRGVPWKSRLGNLVSSAVFCMVSGRYLSDTQTGLRAFDDSLLDLMLEIPGERFEYETNMLLTCVSREIPVRVERIDTVYLGKNEGSHFHPVRDSAAVLGALFGEPLRFVLSSLLCAFLDLFLFWLFDRAAGTGGGQRQFLNIAAATAGARLLSASVNYTLNRYWVFGRGEGWASLQRYLALCAGITAASAVSVSVTAALFGAEPAAVKIFCDGLLFIASWRIQRSRVFPGQRKGGRQYAPGREKGGQKHGG